MSLADRLNKYMIEKEKSITEAAKEIGGISRSTLSQYLSGKYTSDTTNIEQRISEYLERAKEGENIKIKREEFFISKDASDIMAICKSCQDETALGCIVGKSGFGKSETLKKYAQLNKVIYIECTADMTGRDLIGAIEEGIGFPEGKGSSYKRTNAIKEFFLINSGYLLIIDEADKLISKDTIKKLEILRSIFDQSNLGLVVAGEPQLEVDIKTYDTRFANRIDFYIPLKGLSREEVTEYLKGYDATEAALEELISRARNPQNGCFRLLDRTLGNIRRLTNGEDVKITLKLIQEASRMMLL